MTVPQKTLTLTAILGVPLIKPGDDLARLLIDALAAADIAVQDGDVLVVSQKVVSKAEGRYVCLHDVTPSPEAVSLASTTGKDARLVEVILRESSDVIRAAKDVLIVAHRLGYVMANAGVDQSNVQQSSEDERVLLLPFDPDESSRILKERIDDALGVSVAVIISDSFGRPWRIGVVGVAIGCSGLPALVSQVGKPDLFGRKMRVTEIALADEIASAASLLMGETDAGVPLVHLRGVQWSEPPVVARALVRPKSQDMFR
jgi:coenzyme F420-0:L-glutamate ligase/coenzyme F420-1:gamma-L-glutamate ligase